MTELIRVYNTNEEAYKRLSMASEVLNALTTNNYFYYVDDTYFDYGQDWMWTTILRRESCLSGNPTDWSKRGVQVLCPRDYEKILTYKNVLFALAEIIEDDYWSDKEAV